MDAQTEPDDLTGRTFGAWRVASMDATGKRVLAVCVCGQARTLARGALIIGDARRGCGYVSTPPASQNARKATADSTRDIFAEAGKWHRDGWARS
jgi:hypothetical protein